MKRIKDLTGLKVERLTVIEYAGKGNGTRPRCKWNCLCECGNYKIVSSDALSARVTKSCGCLKSPNPEQYQEELKDRLYKYCKIEKDCWIWTGGSFCRGYGHTTIKDKTIACHRASWIAWKGKIPKNMCVLHKCDNPSCINPDHLWLGTQFDNMRDMIEKGRQNYFFKKCKVRQAKLTEAQVLEIRDLYEKDLMKISEICKKYNMTTGSINPLLKRKTWKHI